MSNYEDDIFGSSSSFSAMSHPAEPALGFSGGDRIYKNVPKLSRRESIESWLNHLKRGEYGVRPGDEAKTEYSVDEWEAYLDRRNSDLSFDTFLRYNKWFKRDKDSNSCSSVTIDVQKLMVRKLAAFEFLSDIEFTYVRDLADYIEDLSKLRNDASIHKWEDIEEADSSHNIHMLWMDSQKYRGWVEALKKHNFSVRWRFIPGQSPTNPATIQVKDHFKEKMRYTKARWIRMNKGKEDQFTFSKVRTAVLAVEYGLISSLDELNTTDGGF